VDYELSAHARHVLVERGLQPEWLERVLRRPALRLPDALDAALEHRLARIDEHGGRVLRVVVNVTVRPPRIVTVYFDRTMKDKL
jgi:hypothetical protein